jgi:hypothetical protein
MYSLTITMTLEIHVNSKMVMKFKFITVSNGTLNERNRISQWEEGGDVCVQGKAGGSVGTPSNI